MFNILPGTLYHWYRDHISDYLPDRSSGKWPSKSLMDIDYDTGEILKEQPVYVMKPENVGAKMCIDDKAIGHDGFTIMSNAQTGKIAMMIESCREKELVDALSFFGQDLQKVKSISCDMSPTYLKLCREQIPGAKTAVDKFHVMSYLCDAVLDVLLLKRTRRHDGHELQHLSRGTAPQRRFASPTDRNGLVQLQIHLRKRKV